MPSLTFENPLLLPRLAPICWQSARSAGGRQLAKIPLLVIDLPASADAFAQGIINPLDGAFGVPVADIGPHDIVALVEGLDAIEVAVALPHREDRSPEGLEDQWKQGVLGCQRQSRGNPGRVRIPA